MCFLGNSIVHKRKRQKGKSLTLFRRSQNGLDQKKDAFLHSGWAQLCSLTQEEEVPHLQKEKATLQTKGHGWAANCVSRSQHGYISKNNLQFSLSFQDSS